MAITKVSSTQSKNDGPIKILYLRVNNGTGTRSTTSSTTPAALACTGDTSYTAPSDTNVDILFTMVQMSMNTAGVTRWHLTINGVLQQPGTYHHGTNWLVQTITYKVSVNAGQTITIGCSWLQEGGGTGTATNDSDDQTYPNDITGLVIPRPS
jgi:hypothetical protein